MKRIFDVIITNYFIVLAFIIIASYLIVDHIALRSIWIDEAAVANVINYPFSQLLEKAILDGHHLSYIFPIKLWAEIFSDSELSLRIYSSLWTILLVSLMFKSGKYFFNSKKVGIIAAFLTSTSYFLIWFSIQVRPYTQATFAGLASTYFFVKSVRENKKKDFILYTFFSIICIYNHTWLILIFFSHIAAILLNRGKVYTKKSIYISQSITILSMIPYIFILFKQSSLGVNSWITKVNPLVIFQSFSYLCYGLVIPYLTATAIAYFIFISQKKKQEPFILKFIDFLLILYLFLPILSALIVSQFIPAYVAGRFEIVVLPALLLLLAKIWSKLDPKLLILIFASIFILTYKNVLNEKKEIQAYKSTDKTIAEDILDDIENNDVIITTELSYATLNYYLNHLNTNNKEFELISFPSCIAKHPGWQNQKQMEEDIFTYEKEAEELVNRISNEEVNTIWLIYNTDDNPLNELILNEIQSKYTLFDAIKPEEPRQPAWFDEVYHFYKTTSK